MANKNFKVKGMHCTSCEMLIKDALEELPGIKKVEASFEKNTVNVEFDESKTSEKEIVKTLEKEGYKIDN